ncbi:PREDICTED: uncharacterized protein LOC108382772 [Rhagoletis zephyria]|nr:PREDICTED: uncharacterized protein LOC108382772 [Rhagoletis zephyria]
MCNNNCQNIRYIILCALLGLAYSLPISGENENNNLGPTVTSTTAKPNSLEVNLRHRRQYVPVQDLNSFLILEPIVVQQQPIPFLTVANVHNQRSRRTLTQAELDEPVDVDFDMEVAEVNVFRPLFRYRAEVARNLGRRQQLG